MLKQRIIIIIFIIFSFAISLFLTMPALQAYQWGLFTPDVKMQGISGRLVASKVKTTTIEEVSINNISWQWQPSLLLTGALALEWQIDDEKISGQGKVSTNVFGQHQISKAKIQINTKNVSKYLPKGNSITGDIELDIASITASETLESISATAITKALIINSIIGKFDINTLYLTADGTRNNGFKIHIKQSENDKNMDVLAEIKDNTITLSGYIKTHSNLAKQLSAILPMIAKKQGQQWVVAWQSKLPEW